MRHEGMMTQKTWREERESERGRERETERLRETERETEQERDPRPFGSSYYTFFLSPGLPYVNWASQECCLFYLRSSLQSSDHPLFYFRGLFPSLSFSHLSWVPFSYSNYLTFICWDFAVFKIKSSSQGEWSYFSDVVYNTKKENVLKIWVYVEEIQSVHSRGDQPWVFFGRNDAEAETPVLWPPYTKSWLIGKDSDAGRDWGQEEKGTTEDEMASPTWWMWVWVNSGRWWRAGRPGMLRFMGSQSVGHDWATELNWTEIFIRMKVNHNLGKKWTLKHFMNQSNTLALLHFHDWFMDSHHKAKQNKEPFS